MEQINGTALMKSSLVVKEIDNFFIVWIPNGNQYLRLEEPALFVFKSHEEGKEQQTIISQCTKRYSIPENECRIFVTEIIRGIEAIKQFAIFKESQYSDRDELNSTIFQPFSTRNYSINGKLLRFHFENLQFENYLHPLLQHLEIVSDSSEFVTFELFGYHEQVVLRVNHEVKGIWNKDESHLINGMAFLQLLNAVYEKTEKDWMAIIHASAVSNGTKTIVFTASPGSGKSTMAAMLQQKGFSLVSDDFVPLERISQHVFSFPGAMSVKEGATELLSEWYPSLLNQKSRQTLTNKMVRYLPVDGKAVPAPVKEIIFIKYDPAVDFEMEKLPLSGSLKMLLDETWTFPSAENAVRFLDWYSGISCYRLTYSNNEKALQTIINLFEE